MVKINGEELDYASKPITSYLKDQDINQFSVAVELNEEILAKEEYETRLLKDGDVVEIVRFMGGGQ